MRRLAILLAVLAVLALPQPAHATAHLSPGDSVTVGFFCIEPGARAIFDAPNFPAANLAAQAMVEAGTCLSSPEPLAGKLIARVGEPKDIDTPTPGMIELWAVDLYG